MSLLWLWVALLLYSLGLVHAVVTVALRRERWFRLALGAFALGFLFHFVSLVEHGLDTGRFPVTNISDATSLFAFLITLGFLLGYWAYGVSSLSVFVFPFVFVMTLAAALSQRPLAVGPPILESAWVPLHVSFSLTGYAGMLLAFLAGVMYLFQERELKRRKPRAFYYRLPPLETIDHLGSVALGVGFPFITVGLLLGTANAARHWGPDWMSDPKVMLSFLLWFIYLLLILARVSAGWRGRKAAIFSIVGMAMALASWAGNYLSSHHTFLGR
ncbi:MAG TPA: cytochrome c biogenesis protein CcsA [Candidatus Xenobia bacterium]|nr:cytochrome c biogenesis protein CcsA [Candidatus Xenobia bacterium]